MYNANQILNQSFVYDFGIKSNGSIGQHPTGCQIPLNSTIISYSLFALTPITYNFALGDGSGNYYFSSINGSAASSQLISNYILSFGTTATVDLFINIISAPITSGKIFCNFQYVPIQSAISKVINNYNLLNFKQVIPAAQFQTIVSTPINNMLPAPLANQYYFLVGGNVSKPASGVAYNFGNNKLHIATNANTGGAGLVTNANLASFNVVTAYDTSLVEFGSTLGMLGQSIGMRGLGSDANVGTGDVTVSFIYSLISI